MAKLTRKEFVQGYAERSGLDAKWATLGFIEDDGRYLLALPCACDDDGCQGWAMLSPATALSHLELHAPHPIPAMMRAFIAGNEYSCDEPEAGRAALKAAMEAGR